MTSTFPACIDSGVDLSDGALSQHAPCPEFNPQYYKNNKTYKVQTKIIKSRLSDSLLKWTKEQLLFMIICSSEIVFGMCSLLCADTFGLCAHVEGRRMLGVWFYHLPSYCFRQALSVHPGLGFWPTCSSDQLSVPPQPWGFGLYQLFL